MRSAMRSSDASPTESSDRGRRRASVTRPEPRSVMRPVGGEVGGAVGGAVGVAVRDAVGDAVR